MMSAPVFNSLLFVGLVLAVLWAFSRIPGGGLMKAHEPEHAASGGVRALFAVMTLSMAVMAGLAVVGGGKFDTATFANVRAAGGDEAVAKNGLVIAVGLLALIALLNGYFRKLALILFVGAVLLSVFMASWKFTW